MLVLTRRPGESTVFTAEGNFLGSVKVLKVKGNQVHLGFDIHPGVTVDRLEVHERKMEERRD